MALDIDTDISNVIFDSDEFGVSATYTDTAGSDTTCTVILDVGVEVVGDDGRSLGTQDEVSFDCSEVERPEHRAKVVIGSDTYVIAEVLENDGKIAKCKVVKQ